MAFGFSDLMSSLRSGMGQTSAGMDAIHNLPMNQKMMAAGQILHGGAGPADMLAAANRYGQPGAVPGAVPGAPPAAPTPAPPVAAAAPTQGPDDGSGFLMGLLPLLMKNGMGGGLMGGAGGGSPLGPGLGMLGSAFGFGKH